MNAMDYLNSIGIGEAVLASDCEGFGGLVYQPCIVAYIAKYNEEPNTNVTLSREDMLITYVKDGTLKIDLQEVRKCKKVS